MTKVAVCFDAIMNWLSACRNVNIKKCCLMRQGSPGREFVNEGSVIIAFSEVMPLILIVLV